MKRVIKFWNKFSTDKSAGFSDCGTEYEILPILVPDEAGPIELKAIATSLGVNIKGKKVITHEPPKWNRRGATHMTHAIPTGTQTEPKFMEGKRYDWYIGFVTLEEKGPLKPVEKLGKSVTKEQAREILEDRHYGLDNVGDFSMHPKKVENRIVMSGWNYYHEIKMLGYDLAKFEKLVTGSTKNQDGNREFEDGVFSCDDCGTWDSLDDGYTYNFRDTDEGRLGTNCGCAHEHMKANVEDFANNHKKSISRDTANELEEEGVIERLETFIGGMTDGRGGYYKGQSTREGSPEAVLAEFRKQMPKANFVFVHEESGQFQTYFSIAKLSKAKRKAA